MDFPTITGRLHVLLRFRFHRSPFVHEIWMFDEMIGRVVRKTAVVQMSQRACPSGSIMCFILFLPAVQQRWCACLLGLVDDLLDKTDDETFIVAMVTSSRTSEDHRSISFNDNGGQWPLHLNLRS